MRAEVTTEVEAAITTAWDAADPDPTTAMRYVFAEPDADAHAGARSDR